MAVTDNELYTLCKSEMEYRNKLLEKYANILTRSEGRVDNINHMVADLITLSRACNERMEKEQEHVGKMVDLLVAKDRRIRELEQKVDEEHKRYQALVEKYITAGSKSTENTFNIK